MRAASFHEPARLRATAVELTGLLTAPGFHCWRPTNSNGGVVNCRNFKDTLIINGANGIASFSCCSQKMGHAGDLHNLWRSDGGNVGKLWTVSRSSGSAGRNPTAGCMERSQTDVVREESEAFEAVLELVHVGGPATVPLGPAGIFNPLRGSNETGKWGRRFCSRRRGRQSKP